MDIPAHGMVPSGSQGLPNVVKSVMNSLIKTRSISLSTHSVQMQRKLQRKICQECMPIIRPENVDKREIASIPIVPAHQELVTAHDSDGRSEEKFGGHGINCVCLWAVWINAALRLGKSGGCLQRISCSS